MHIMSDRPEWLGEEWSVPGYDSEVPIELRALRILRRWAKANGKHRKVRVSVPDLRRQNDDGVVKIGDRLVDTTTGQVLERRLTVTRGPFVGGSAGFVSVNDGVAFAEQLLRALTSRSSGSLSQADRLAAARIEQRRRAVEEYSAALKRAA